MIIHPKTTSADPDLCVRRIYPSDYSFKDNIWLSWPMHEVADRYTQVIIRTKTTSIDPDPGVRWQANIPKWLSIHGQHLMILTHASGGRRIYPSDYPYKDNIWWSWPMHQVVGRYTQVIIRTKTTSVDPDPCVRWQADIPKWLSIQRKHLLILTHASGGRRKYPKCLSIQTQFCYPDLWELR